MPFTTTITVRFGEVDPAGLVYYPVIFHYAHVALEEFVMARFGMPYSRLISEFGIGYPTVNVQAEFFVPMVYGDEVDVEVMVLNIGRSSLTLEYTFRRHSDNTMFSRATNVHVCMNLGSRRPVEISAEHRQLLAKQE